MFVSSASVTSEARPPQRGHRNMVKGIRNRKPKTTTKPSGIEKISTINICYDKLLDKEEVLPKQEVEALKCEKTLSKKESSPKVQRE